MPDKFRALRITALDEMTSTSNANPRWRVTFGEERGVTSDDIADAPGVGNPGVRPGDTVHVSFTRAARIRRIHAPRWQDDGKCYRCPIVREP